jgi:signal transduction histidine kinase
LRALAARTRGIDRLAIMLSAVGCLAAIVAFQGFTHKVPEVGQHWQLTFYLLLVLIFLFASVAVEMRSRKRLRTYLLLLRLLATALAVYPLGGDLAIELLLGITLLMEAAVIIAFPYCIAFIALSTAVLMVLQEPIVAWGVVMSAPSVSERMVFGILLLLTGASAGLTSVFRSKFMTEAELTDRYNMAMSQIIEANIGFQEYANTVNEQSVSNERKRISREIHDTIGYSLTNIIMLSQQALYAARPEDENVRDLLATLNTEAREGLKDIRRALLELRIVEEEKLPGLKVITKITKIFAAATGTSVDLQVGNAPWDFRDDVNAFLYRMIQEGLTNSYRHGGATRVKVRLWVQQGELCVIIHDNGKGTTEVIPGIGLSGMKERIDHLQGHLSAKSVSDGFELMAKLPL